MATIHPITIAEFVRLMVGGVRHSLGGLVGVTVPKLTFKDRGDHSRTWAVAFPNVDKANVRKITHGAIVVGPDYVKQVLGKLEAQGKEASEYKAGDTWHEAVPGTKCLRQHKRTGELYFWCGFAQRRPKKDKDGNPVLNAEGRPVYVHIKPKVRYIDISTGDTLPTADLKGFLPKDRTPTNQGVDEGTESIVRCYKLESVKTLVVDGKAYTIVGKTL